MTGYFIIKYFELYHFMVCLQYINCRGWPKSGKIVSFVIQMLVSMMSREEIKVHSWSTYRKIFIKIILTLLYEETANSSRTEKSDGSKRKGLTFGQLQGASWR
jgi:hypothetical protein